MKAYLFIMFLMAALAPYVIGEAKNPEQAHNPVYDSLQPSFEDKELHLRNEREIRTETLQQQLEGYVIDGLDNIVRNVRSNEDESKNHSFNTIKKPKIILNGSTNTSLGMMEWQIGKEETGHYCIVLKLVAPVKSPADLMAAINVATFFSNNA